MQRIVIVGGGIAGVVVATHMGRRNARRHDADIVLVDRNPAHVWKPMLHTFAAGTATYANENIPFVTQAKRASFRYHPGTLASRTARRARWNWGRCRCPTA